MGCMMNYIFVSFQSGCCLSPRYAFLRLTASLTNRTGRRYMTVSIKRCTLH